MICPRCGETIEVTQSVVATSKGWMHKSCGGWTFIESKPIASVSETAATLVALISRMLEVEPMDQTPEQWRDARARNIAMRLINDFEIKERK